MDIFADFGARVRATIERLGWTAADGSALDLTRVVVEPPRDAAHGDLAVNAAMVLAKPMGKNP
ncbi:MAG: arginine--tRNA ligase, partial [Phyllobacteriaceae bacterium]|nr:arginine--tRNA ligase [Phyllobacteriaceae bacterium]